MRLALGIAILAAWATLAGFALGPVLAGWMGAG